MSSINCHDYPDLQANPDISGVGALVGFMATSYITLICCVTKSYLEHKRFKGNSSLNINKWANALQIAIITFSDQQSITGISIAIGAFAQISSGISAYHWQTAVNLAWFSTITHLLTLTTLRSEPIEGGKKFPSKINILRASIMFVLTSMVCCMLYPIGYLTSSNSLSPEYPTLCLYRQITPTGLSYNILYIILTMGILVFGSLTRVRLLFVGQTPPGQYPGKHWTSLEGPLRRFSCSQTEHTAIQNLGRAALYRSIRCIYMLMISGHGLYASRLWELTWLSFAIFWGTIRIIWVREFGYSSEDFPQVSAQERMWGFGQVLPVGLLALPLINLIGAYWSNDLVVMKPTTTNNEPDMINTQTLGFMPEVILPNAVRTLCPEASALKRDPWHWPLLILWYLLSIYLAIHLLVDFPARVNEGVLDPTDGGYHIQQIIIFYIQAVSIDLMILAVSTIIILDPDVRRFWKKIIPRHLILKRWAVRLGWSVVVLVLLFLSILFASRKEFFGAN